MKKYFLYLVLVWVIPICLTAQTISNVVAKQVGNTIEVTYDVDKDCIVKLLLSRDNGISFEDTPRSLKGDVGKVAAGHNVITWNLLEDGDNWSISQARFMVAIINNKNRMYTVNGVSFNMIFVEGGTFMMGCTSDQDTDCSSDELPIHKVSLTDYYIGETEVTQALWNAVMDKNPSHFKKGPNYPVENINFDDCLLFVRKLNSLLASQIGNLHFSIQTEAQWEYAARGGHKENKCKYSGSELPYNIAWYADNSEETTHPVAQKKPNVLGIYDMSGNVCEWCRDFYGEYEHRKQKNPTGPNSGRQRVIRGGGWNSDANICRVSARSVRSSNYFYSYCGLRIVLESSK